MNRLASLLLATLLAFGLSASVTAAEPPARLAELDAFWREASRTVREGDFAGYKATYHEDAVLVSLKDSVPIGNALARWKPGFDNTKAGKMKASVQFKFAKRIGDNTTAHESGIFLYSETDAAGKTKDSYVHFDALLVKRGGWKMVMEYQKNEATKAEWDALPEK
jgi:ketosteroid isomerase-like protein